MLYIIKLKEIPKACVSPMYDGLGVLSIGYKNIFVDCEVVLTSNPRLVNNWEDGRVVVPIMYVGNNTEKLIRYGGGISEIITSLERALLNKLIREDLENGKKTDRPVSWGTPRLDRDGELIFVGEDEMLVQVEEGKVRVIKTKDYKEHMLVLSIGSKFECMRRDERS